MELSTERYFFPRFQVLPLYNFWSCIYDKTIYYLFFVLYPTVDNGNLSSGKIRYFSSLYHEEPLQPYSVV